MIIVLRFLNCINLSVIRTRAEVSLIMVILILILDLHRYGAWYTGNQCYLRPYGIPLLMVAGLPLIIYAAASIVQRIVSRGWYMLLYLSRIFIFTLPLGLINEYTFKYVFNEQVWYEQFIFRTPDFNFFIGVAAAMIAPSVIVVSLWIIGQVHGYIFSI